MKFLSSVCICAIIIAAFRMLIPENKMKHQIAFLAAGVFLLVSISSVSGAEIILDWQSAELAENDGYVQFSGEINESLRTKICDEMSEKVYSLLNEHDIQPKEVHIIVNISGLYSINITQVKLVFRREDMSKVDLAVSLLEKELVGNIEISTSADG